ncbi:MAG: HNH endonuclease [Acidobacteriota bacterium]|nr:HNH endonuclease [Acidobacteriota bacterium]
MPPKMGSKTKVREFLLRNIGRVLDSDEIRAASGNVSEWGRRLRELRDEEGYQILSHKDRDDLKPGQYRLDTAKRRPAFARKMSKETRAWVLERNGYTCQMCGVAAGDIDPYNPDRTIRLTIGHILEKDKGGSDEPGNLRAVCSNCNEGLQNISPPKPDRLQLLTYIRKATRDDQLEVLTWLLTKFPDRKV